MRTSIFAALVAAFVLGTAPVAAAAPSTGPAAVQLGAKTKHKRAKRSKRSKRKAKTKARAKRKAD